MTIRYFDGFDLYAGGALQTGIPYNADQFVDCSISTSGKINGNNTLAITGSALDFTGVFYAGPTLLYDGTVTVGGNVLYTNVLGTDNFYFCFKGAGGSNTHFSFGVNAAQFTLMGPAGKTIIKAAGAALDNTPYFVEFQITASFNQISSEYTVLGITVRVNGVVFYQDNTLNLNFGASIATGWWAPTRDTSGGGDITYIDDVYYADSSTGFLGPVICTMLEPTSDIALGDWTVVGTLTGYEALDNNPPVGGQYINAAAAGTASKFGIAPLPSNAFQIFAVGVTYYAEKSDSATVGISSVIYSGANEATGTNVAPNETYSYWQDIYTTDPATGQPFNPATFNLDVGFVRTQ